MVTKTRIASLIRHMFSRRSTRGFSLAEVMFTVAIMGIVASIGSQLLIHFTRFQAISSARAELQKDARIAIDLMNRNIRQAVSSTLTVDQAADQPPFSRITFQTIAGKNISYYQSGKQLIQVADSVTSILTRNLRFIAFAYQDTSEDDIISMSISLERSTYESKSSIFKLSIEKVRIMN